MSREQLFKKIVSILIRCRAKKMAIFGSYARGEAKTESDIDILVEFSERKSFWCGFRCGLGHRRHPTIEEQNQKSH
ncbi:MAG: nucleotidyltransferase domain-containing protein [Methanophagales archaeon]|nr:nucleotidyltransferase domain-containing protein [Methanophagales archaeon]